MAQVRVGSSIARAYAFLFARFFSIVGFSWLPCSFLAVLSSWWLTRLSESAVLIATRAGPAPRMIGETLGFVLFALLLASTIVVPLSRLALGEDVEGAAARFAIGARELKLFFALLRLSAIALTALMILAVGLAASVEAGLVHVIARALPGSTQFSSPSGDLWQGLPIRGLVVAAGTALAFVIVAVLASRLGLFLVPVAAAENSTSLSRAAALSRGNTWRLLIVCAALAAPVLCLLAALEFLVLGPPVRENLQHALSAGMPDRALEILASHAPAIAVVASMAAVGFLSLIAGASATAYRDRGEDVPLVSRVPTKRREPRETRDSSPTVIDIGRAPAFAKIHPLATLLPAEMPTVTAHPDEPPSAVEQVGLGQGEESAVRTGAVPAPSSDESEYSLTAERASVTEAILPPHGEASESVFANSIVQAEGVDANEAAAPDQAREL